VDNTIITASLLFLEEPHNLELAAYKIVISVALNISSGLNMAMGDKLFEEKGKMTMTFVESIDANGLVMKQSFNSDVMGVGKFPSGMNMGSGTIWTGMDNKAHGKWHGMMMTQDNETIVWKGSGHSKRDHGAVRGIMVVTFMTKSEKYGWLNSIIVVNEIEGNMMEFKSTAYEWK
jgi:hypothetical protein